MVVLAAHCSATMSPLELQLIPGQGKHRRQSWDPSCAQGCLCFFYSTLPVQDGPRFQMPWQSRACSVCFPLPSSDRIYGKTAFQAHCYMGGGHGASESALIASLETGSLFPSQVLSPQSCYGNNREPQHRKKIGCFHEKPHLSTVTCFSFKGEIVSTFKAGFNKMTGSGRCARCSCCP